MFHQAPRLFALLPRLHSSHRHTLHTLSITSREIRAAARCYKHTTSQVRTFLSSKESVHNFVSMLSVDERQRLQQELNAQASESSNKTEADKSSPNQSEENDHHHRPPSYIELRQIAIHQSLPFIGFGFLDNLIMIIAGDYIDLTLGVTFGISTMAAAGLGNALSDVAGIGSAFYVERLSDKIGVKSPTLSLIQLQMARTRWATQIGRAVGITIGCIIGMFPLLFLPHKQTVHAKHELEDEEREN